MSELEELLPGARVAVTQCLAIESDDRVFIITDKVTREIGDALYRASRERGATVEMRQLEEFGERPLTAIPDSLLEALRGFAPTATFYAAQGQPGEIRFRIPLGQTLRNDFKVRHGHMIGITPDLMKTGMTADYERIAELTLSVNDRVKNAREIRVTNAAGTDFTAYLDPQSLVWHPCTGIYHNPGEWGNLPEGETFTAPASAEGILTATLLGDHFSDKYGLLDEPVVFHIEEGEVVSVEHPNADIADDVWAYLNSSENGRRVGEFAIGTNTALTELSGNLLQDEKFPGVHVAFGNPYPDITGAQWDSDVHVDVIPLDVSVWVDGEQLLEDGRFLI